MALLAPDGKTIIMRIVYAGPPLAGKTATLHALAELLLGRRAEEAVFSPGAAQGRTLYFDWLDYSGGSFKGRRLRCQIVSVPGQVALTERRRMILEAADAVILVIDSRPEHIAAARQAWQEMVPWLERPLDDPPVGVMVQANKRDLPGALSIDEIKQQMGGTATVGVVATTATAGEGVREAFVKGVGLALERVAALMQGQRLLHGNPEVNSGEDLLQAMEAAENALPLEESTLIDSIFQEAMDGQEKSSSVLRFLSSSMVKPIARMVTGHTSKTKEQATPISPSTDEDFPKLPGMKLPPGRVWPPIAGRIALYELANHDGVPALHEDGSWRHDAGSWWLVSPAQQCFGSLEEGQQGMRAYARLHKTLESILSAHRCVALASAGQYTWRLWEIVRHEKPLHHDIERFLQDTRPVALSARLVAVANVLLQLARFVQEKQLALPVTLQTLALEKNKVIYTDAILPLVTSTPSHTPASTVDMVAFLQAQLAAPVAAALAQGTINVPAVLRALKRQQVDNKISQDVLEALAALFLA